MRIQATKVGNGWIIQPAPPFENNSPVMLDDMRVVLGSDPGALGQQMIDLDRELEEKSKGYIGRSR